MDVCLTEDDILELGWESIGYGWYNLKNVSGKLGDYLYVRLRIWGKASFIKAYRADPKEYPNFLDGSEETYLFVGEIKNKEVLQNLMEWT